MLHVATIHYKSPRWIEIQAKYLKRHISAPFQTWGSIEGIDRSYGSFFDHLLQQRGPHPGKLNHLALEIAQVADERDLIMFLDGDAFPIADPMPVIEDAFERAPLVAVRRAENLDEPQPHPSFCVTTVGHWRSLPGDWSLGPLWTVSNGNQVTDVGANLLRALQLSNTPWVHLLRTNGSRLHPLFFGVYGDIVYHHGAGFRENALPRVDRDRLKAQPPPRRPLRDGLQRIRGGAETGVRGGAETLERNNRHSNLIYEAIRRDDPDWLVRVKGEAQLDRGVA